MTSSSTDNTVPTASIGGASGSSTDSLSALFSQLNVSGTSTVALTSTLHDVVQNAVIAALQEVATASTGAPALAGPSTPAIPATPTNTVPTATAFQTANMVTTPAANTVTTPANTATLPVRTHHGVMYHVPCQDASGPFYWVSRGHRIGIFATWQGTSTHVTGVSCASFSRVHLVAEGIRLIMEAIDCRETEIIP
ncbi:hypothetical protein DFH29DRAFT_1004532 [Suillus ampliporus]|nr:hypothetical protein DFH29DRAFT_1004532 [Suillus ampliporus]